MRHLKSYLLMLVAALVAVGCADEFDRPPVNAPVAENLEKVNTTIYDLKYKYWDDARNYIDTIGVNEDGEEIYIKGRVVSSDETGNIYKSLVIQDETAALALSINQSSLYTTYRLGQEIVIKATGMYIGKYNGLQQLGYPAWYDAQKTWEATFMALELFQEHAELNGFPDVNKIDTVAVSLGSLHSDPQGLCKYQSQLVRLDDVTFTEADGQMVFAGDDDSANRTLQDLNGNSIIVRNSNYADFRSEKLPVGTGSVVGILSYFGTNWQLLLRSAEDCIGFSTETKGLKDNPYTMEDVAALQGTGKTGWFTGYIVGAVKPGVESVASNDDIQWEAPAAMANTIVLGATADTKDIANCVIIELADGSALRKAVNLVDNADVLGKNLLVKASAFKNVMGQNGLATSGTSADFVLEGMAPADGDGTKEAPYSVAKAKSVASATGVWVQGYIVGCVNDMSLSKGTIGLPDASVTTNDNGAKNLLIADNPNPSSIDECFPIQLPTSIRAALNLVQNPGNLGKKLKVSGDITAYFGAIGVKNTSEYEIEGGASSGGDDTSVTTDPVTSLNEGFDTSIPSNWTKVVVAGSTSYGPQEWFYKSYDNNGYASMTGFSSNNSSVPPFDSWLITPALNVKDATNKALSFRTQVNGYGNKTSVFEVYVMTTNDPATSTSTKLNPTIATAPASGYSDWAESGSLDLSSYGDVVYVGFRFYATADANYATWCVDDVKFGDVTDDGGNENPGTGGEDPGTGGEDPGTGGEDTPTSVGTKDAPISVAELKSTYKEGEEIEAWVVGYIVGGVDGTIPLQMSGAIIGLGTTKKTNILIADTPNPTTAEETSPVKLPSNVQTALNLVDNPGNLGQKVKLKGIIKTYLNVAGLETVTEYEFVKNNTEI